MEAGIAFAPALEVVVDGVLVTKTWRNLEKALAEQWNAKASAVHSLLGDSRGEKVREAKKKAKEAKKKAKQKASEAKKSASSK